MINKVGNRYSLFTLTIACIVDRYAEAVTRLPSIFQIRILLDCANDGFAPDARSVGFKVPPEELPTIRSLLPLAKPQISSLIADSHGPSSGDYCTGDELKAACWDRWNVRLASPFMPENFDVARANRERQQVFCGKEDMGTVIISNPQSDPQSMMSCATSAYFGSPRGLLSCCKTYPCHLDTVEVCGSSPHGPTILFKQLHIRPIFLQPDVQPEVGACATVRGAFCGF